MEINRYTVILKFVMEILKEYWMVSKHEIWHFMGSKQNSQLTTRIVELILKRPSLKQRLLKILLFRS